jgi:hypothetical protein
MHHGHRHAEPCHSYVPGRGPAVYYGYCPESQHMRMMDYSDYVSSMRSAYAQVCAAMYKNAQRSMEAWSESMHRWMGRCEEERSARHPEREDHEHDECGCHEKREDECHEHDCHCSCCIRDADAIEYTRCGETRLIPLTFDNNSRRERDVKLQMGAFATAGGKEVGWRAELSETEFKLPPCGEKTVTVRVTVDCASFAGQREGDQQPSVEDCKVAYATVRAEGCLIRPLVVAVAVLPNDCGSHRAGCLCGCCC